MKNILLILLTIIPLYSLSQLPPNDSRYELVFEDEFNKTTVDDNKWKFSMPWNQTGHTGDWCNNIPGGIGHDLYGYRKRNWDNCILDTSGSGSLTIVSKRENYLGQIWNWPLCTDDSCSVGVGYHACMYNYDPPICWDVDHVWFKYTTNQLISHERFKYGYFEIRCKIPVPSYPKTNTGIGPNFWLWGVGGDVTWSEIDIFEFNGSNNTFGSAIHYEDIHGNKLHGIPDHPPLISVGDSKFHKYAVHWEPHELKFYFDDKLYLTTRLYADKLVAMPLIIDVNFPLHTMCQLLDNSSQLPHHYEIDYVKVYQLKYDCNGDYHICNNTGTDLIHYEDVIIGGLGCNTKVTPGNTLNIHSNSLSINGIFTIEAGAQLNYSYYPCYKSLHILPGSTKSAIIPAPAPESYYKRLKFKYHELK